jgi:phage shock protein PspC (stress-responsive transcriptional regulator)
MHVFILNIILIGEGFMVTTANKKLIRCPKYSAGLVCTALAKYFDLNKTWIQAGFIISSLFHGCSVLLYLMLPRLIPKRT